MRRGSWPSPSTPRPAAPAAAARRASSASSSCWWSLMARCTRRQRSSRCASSSSSSSWATNTLSQKFPQRARARAAPDRSRSSSARSLGVGGAWWGPPPPDPPPRPRFAPTSPRRAAAFTSSMASVSGPTPADGAGWAPRMAHLTQARAPWIQLGLCKVTRTRLPLGKATANRLASQPGTTTRPRRPWPAPRPSVRRGAVEFPSIATSSHRSMSPTHSTSAVTSSPPPPAPSPAPAAAAATVQVARPLALGYRIGTGKPTPSRRAALLLASVLSRMRPATRHWIEPIWCTSPGLSAPPSSAFTM
mmetsp:Transcript_39931/g.68925  ORF Transcript_39931/g.68925 Transcript_39931/m.68925 type:complete len:304 (-) Transcript_39931:709-1620(-)